MARDFSGASQYLRATVVPASAVPMTLAGWYKYDTAIADDGEHTVLSITDAGGVQEHTIEIGRTGGVDYAIAMLNSGGAVGFALSSVAPTINTWQHLGGTYSTTTRRDVFLDGVNRGNDTSLITPISLSDTMIGAVSSSSSIIKPFNGVLAELGIWNRVLTDAEMATLAQGYAPSFIPQGLVFYAPVTGQNTPEINKKSSIPLDVTGATKVDHPDFIKYPGKSNRGVNTRPNAFAPGLAR